MTGKIQASLFLTDSEREEILNLADSLLESDVESEEELEVAQRWAGILYRLVLGKRLQGSQHFPTVLYRSKDASSD